MLLYFPSLSDVYSHIETHELENGVKYIRRTTSVGFGGDGGYGLGYVSPARDRSRQDSGSRNLSLRVIRSTATPNTSATATKCTLHRPINVE